MGLIEITYKQMKSIYRKEKEQHKFETKLIGIFGLIYFLALVLVAYKLGITLN